MIPSFFQNNNILKIHLCLVYRIFFFLHTYNFHIFASKISKIVELLVNDPCPLHILNGQSAIVTHRNPLLKKNQAGVFSLLFEICLYIYPWNSKSSFMGSSKMRAVQGM